MCEPTWVENIGWGALGVAVFVIMGSAAVLLLGAAASFVKQMASDSTVNSALEKSQVPPAEPARKYDGRDGNGYQPEAGQDRPVNPPPRNP